MPLLYAEFEITIKTTFTLDDLVREGCLTENQASKMTQQDMLKIRDRIIASFSANMYEAASEAISDILDEWEQAK